MTSRTRQTDQMRRPAREARELEVEERVAPQGEGPEGEASLSETPEGEAPERDVPERDVPERAAPKRAAAGRTALERAARQRSGPEPDAATRSLRPLLRRTAEPPRVGGKHGARMRQRNRQG
jgi:hypothetical protein